MTTRRRFLFSLAGASMALAAPARRPPNIVFILADDLGWTDLACFGSPLYRTPNIDRLAHEGIKFTDAYAACPVCSPTRAGIMTGKYPARLHLTDWIPGRTPPGMKMKVPEWTPYLPLNETTLAKALKPAGYTSACIGKWHLGDEPYYPEKHGFDFNFGGCHLGSPPSYFYPYEIPNVTSGKPDEYLTDRLGDEAVAFLERARSRPFFLYLSQYAVHTPIQAKPEMAAGYRGRVRPGMGHNYPEYAAMIESMDACVGRVLRKLDELGLAGNTIVIFTSDNGGVVGRRHITSNEPLRGEKGTLYEGGIRVPLIVRWPGAVRPGTVTDAAVSSVDHFPTLLEAAGLPAAPGIDGVSLVPLLRTGRAPQPRALYWHYPHYNFHQALVPTRPCGAMRKGDYKLIEFYEDDAVELYNLRDDLSERTNLVRTERKRAAELRAEFAAWRKAVGAQMPAPAPENYDPAKTDEWMRNRFRRQTG